MKNTPENILKLVTEMRSNMLKCHDYYTQINETAEAEHVISKAHAYSEIIFMFEDEEYFNKLCKIFMKDDDLKVISL